MAPFWCSARKRAPQDFAKSDPYVKNGVVTKWEVKKWMTVIGDGAEMPKL